MSTSVSPETAAMIAALRPHDSALSVKAQADLWIKLGIVTFSVVMVGGFGLIVSEISRAEMAASNNSEKIDQLTENVTLLVSASQNMQNELTKRGDWMDGQNLYSEESRLKDQEHTQRLDALERQNR